MRRFLPKGLVGIVVICLCILGWSFLVEAIAQRSETAMGSGLVRLHVLAHSDSPSDQKLKLMVRDAVLAYLSPILENVNDKAEVRRIVLENRPCLIKTASETLLQQGVYYPVDVEYGEFDFPIKSYGEIVIPAGRYEAIRVLIGDAEGANWWCVLFPPLCFIDESKVVVESGDPVIEANVQSVEKSVEFRYKIAELIQSL